jgi:Domain of unknown function (DUF2017)
MMIEQPFMPRGDGSVEAKLRVEETEALLRVAGDLLNELDDVGDPGLKRLFPPAYQNDANAEEEFASLTKDDLIENKKLAANRVIKSIQHGKKKRGTWSARLDEETAASWLGLVNDARLILGTRLDVTEEMDHGPLPPDAPRAAEHNLYVYLSALEWALVEAMMVGLPPAVED